MDNATSKELYIMNGGNKVQILKDGFRDVYSATAEEEALWLKDVIANALAKLESAENATTLTFGVETLVFHKYPNLQNLILKKLKNTSAPRQIVLAAALWKNFKYNKSFDIIHQNFLLHRHECLDLVFQALIDVKGNVQANLFLVFCLEGEDDQLLRKAHSTLTMWAYTCLPELREDNLLEKLNPENKHLSSYNEAVSTLKTSLHIKQK